MPQENDELRLVVIDLPDYEPRMSFSFVNGEPTKPELIVTPAILADPVKLKELLEVAQEECEKMKLAREESRMRRKEFEAEISRLTGKVTGTGGDANGEAYGTGREKSLIE
ncbi:hypothetical protein SY88_09675 [Clostridiales bacterium PH28_bin88]|nr:hypothetical protein SY88_09675 [Clostridiales bacterium PH28_bin88]